MKDAETCRWWHRGHLLCGHTGCSPNNCSEWELKRGKDMETTNGQAVKFEETDSYFKLTIGNKTWYWNKDTGEYDGTSSLRTPKPKSI